MNESASSPVWSRSGGEIFIITADGQFKALRISTNPVPDWSNPQTLFRAQGITSVGSGSTNYDVTRDGQHFLIVTPSDAGSTVANPEVQIVLNWHEELKRLVRLVHGVVHNLAVDDRQYGLELLDRVIGHALRIEVVVAQHHEIGELARFDRAEPCFFFRNQPFSAV